MNRSDQINELFSALAKAQGEIRPASMDATNPHFRTRYATLTAIQEACRGPLSKHGLSVIQSVESTDNGFSIETMLAHSSGQWISSNFKLLIGKQDMQGLGAAVTYARRYSIAAMVGIVSDEDDDANSVSKSQPQRRPPQNDQGVPKAFLEARAQREAAEKEQSKTDELMGTEPEPPSQKTVKNYADDIKRKNLDEMKARAEQDTGPRHDDVDTGYGQQTTASKTFDPGDYVVLVGKKFKGISLKKLKIADVRYMVDWGAGVIKESGSKPINPNIADLVNYGNDYLRMKQTEADKNRFAPPGI